MHVVGTKGQVVIAKEIRDKLGIRPGWLSVQRLVGERVEIAFVPPEHDRSLLGALSEYVSGSAMEPAGESEPAWSEAARQRAEGWGAEPAPR